MFQGFRWQFIVLTLATIVFIAAAMVRLSRRAIQPSPAPPSPTQFLNDAATSEPPRQNQGREHVKTGRMSTTVSKMTTMDNTRRCSLDASPGLFLLHHALQRHHRDGAAVRGEVDTVVFLQTTPPLPHWPA